jgi:hypothetical protein
VWDDNVFLPLTGRRLRRDGVPPMKTIGSTSSSRFRSVAAFALSATFGTTWG